MKPILIPALTALLITGAGCATMDDGDRTRAQGAGFGAAIGALAGGIIGHQSGSAAEGALIGALAGAAGGALYGNHVAGKKADYASQEDYLDACIAQAQSVTTDAQAYCNTLETELARLETEVARVVAAAQNEETERTEWVALQQDIEQRIAMSQEGLQDLDDELRIQKEVAAAEADQGAEEKLTALNEQIALLESQKAELTSQTEKLVALNESLTA